MQTREHFEKLILEKAMKDEAFRTELLKNPKMTLEKEIGVKIPESINIRILEEKSDTFYLVLPPSDEKSTDGELTERELQNVAAGGNDWWDKFSDAICDFTMGC